MELRKDNPYGVLGFIINYVDGTQELDRFRLQVMHNVEDTLHTIKDFETLLDISFDYYKNCRYWWVLKDVNGIENSFDLQVGSTIIIPNISLIKSVLT